MDCTENVSFIICLFSHCERKSMSTELFPINSCCTAALFMQLLLGNVPTCHSVMCYIMCMNWTQLKWKSRTLAVVTGWRRDSRIGSPCVHTTGCAYIPTGSSAGHHYPAHTRHWAAFTKTYVMILINNEGFLMGSCEIWWQQLTHHMCRPMAWVKNIYIWDLEMSSVLPIENS
jgi:hypothetical protein